MRLVLTFRVYGAEPSPWTVPNIGTREIAYADGKKRKVRWATREKKSNLTAGVCSMSDWQKLVRTAAADAMLKAGYPSPLTVPLAIDYEFIAATPTGYRHGQLWDVRLRFDKTKNRWKKLCRPGSGRTDADTTNMLKSTEDALEGVVMVNDAQVRKQSCLALYGLVPGVVVNVWTIEPGDYPGDGEPVP